MSRKFFRWINGFALLVISSLCYQCASRIPRSLGPLREVTVITDYWYAVDTVVERILQRRIMTPQPEPEFQIRKGDFSRFPALSRMRLVFLIGTVRDTLIRTIVGSRLDSLRDPGYGLFKFPNAWVDNQWALVFVAQNETILGPGLRHYAQRINQTVTDMVIEQMARATYLRGGDVNLTRRLMTSYGWQIDVPQKWLLQEKDSADNFVYIFTHFPDRSIFVYWQDTVFPLDPAAIIGERDRLTGRFYDGDSVDRKAVIAETTDFLGVPALRIRGVWQNRKAVLGGPFILYAFNYHGRMFFVDGVVFNPGEKKLSNLFQVEAIIRTFIPGGVLKG